MSRVKCLFGFHNWKWGKKLGVLPSLDIHFAFCSRCQKSRTEYIVEKKPKETQ